MAHYALLLLLSSLIGLLLLSSLCLLKKRKKIFILNMREDILFLLPQVILPWVSLCVFGVFFFFSYKVTRLPGFRSVPMT